MKSIKDIFKNKIILKIEKLGYTEKQANIIYEKYQFINFMDTSYSESDLTKIVSFLNTCDPLTISYIGNLKPEKRILMVDVYNSLLVTNKINNQIFRLIYDIACSYDEKVLSVAINKIYKDKVDYTFIGVLKKVREENLSLYDLNDFKDLNSKKKIK